MRRDAAHSLWQILGCHAIGVVLCLGQPAPNAPASHLAVPLQPYALKLESFVPSPGAVLGVSLKVRINGGRMLHLLLDSGAEHIVLTRGTARSAGIPAGAKLALVGFGRADANASSSVARMVEVGPLCFRDFPVDVVDHEMVDGADGVLPLVLFSDFMVRLDFPRKVLELTPYRTAGESQERFTRARAVNAVLFLRTALDELHNGYFLLDTGAAHNAVSRRIANTMGASGDLALRRTVLGASGASEVLAMRSPVHFRTANQEITSDDVVMVDLDTMSRYNGLEVAGLLGYPALKNYVVTVNYRDSLVRMDTQ
jgi:hypothetical protein